jgi:hypothetical protein
MFVELTKKVTKGESDTPTNFKILYPKRFRLNLDFKGIPALKLVKCRDFIVIYE